jgi:hypothetical protein
VTLCQQRRCQVTALSYRAADRHRDVELVLSVQASSWHGDRLAVWLAGLVDVLEVREAGGGPARGLATRPGDPESGLGPAAPAERPAQ